VNAHPTIVAAAMTAATAFLNTFFIVGVLLIYIIYYNQFGNKNNGVPIGTPLK
jgi:preprotein translocase subunit SecG